MNIWKQWFEDNYKYIALSAVATDEERDIVMTLSDICDKHGISFKAYMDILCELQEASNK